VVKITSWEEELSLRQIAENTKVCTASVENSRQLTSHPWKGQPTDIPCRQRQITPDPRVRISQPHAATSQQSRLEPMHFIKTRSTPQMNAPESTEIRRYPLPNAVDHENGFGVAALEPRRAAEIGCQNVLGRRGIKVGPICEGFSKRPRRTLATTFDRRSMHPYSAQGQQRPSLKALDGF